MLKIAIIGASSFLAKYIINTFEKEDVDLVLFSRSTIIGEHRHITFEYPNQTLDFNFLLSFDVIIYAAAAGVQSSKKYSTEHIYGLNTFIPVSLSNYLSEHQFTGKLITFGSYFEIGANNLLDYFTEEDVVSAIGEVPNHYCTSKRMLSRFCFDAMKKCNHYHIILPSVYGRYEDGQRLIPYLINALSRNETVKLTAGTQIRQFLHGLDVASFVLAICNNNIQPGLWNLATSDYCSVKDVVSTIFNFFEKDPMLSLGQLNKADEAMQVLLINNTKAMNVGWSPSITLTDGIKDYITPSFF